MEATSDSVRFYGVLGLASTPPPSQEAIRTAYKQKALQFHPDKNPGNTEAENEIAKACSGLEASDTNHLAPPAPATSTTPPTTSPSRTAPPTTKSTFSLRGVIRQQEEKRRQQKAQELKEATGKIEAEMRGILTASGIQRSFTVVEIKNLDVVVQYVTRTAKREEDKEDLFEEFLRCFEWNFTRPAASATWASDGGVWYLRNLKDVEANEKILEEVESIMISQTPQKWIWHQGEIQQSMSSLFGEYIGTAMQFFKDLKLRLTSSEEMIGSTRFCIQREWTLESDQPGVSIPRTFVWRDIRSKVSLARNAQMVSEVLAEMESGGIRNPSAASRVCWSQSDVHGLSCFELGELGYVGRVAQFFDDLEAKLRGSPNWAIEQSSAARGGKQNDSSSPSSASTKIYTNTHAAVEELNTTSVEPDLTSRIDDAHDHAAPTRDPESTSLREDCCTTIESFGFSSEDDSDAAPELSVVGEPRELSMPPSSTNTGKCHHDPSSPSSASGPRELWPPSPPPPSGATRGAENVSHDGTSEEKNNPAGAAAEVEVKAIESLAGAEVSHVLVAEIVEAMTLGDQIPLWDRALISKFPDVSRRYAEGLSSASAFFQALEEKLSALPDLWIIEDPNPHGEGKEEPHTAAASSTTTTVPVYRRKDHRTPDELQSNVSVVAEVAAGMTASEHTVWTKSAIFQEVPAAKKYHGTPAQLILDLDAMFPSATTGNSQAVWIGNHPLDRNRVYSWRHDNTKEHPSVLEAIEAGMSSGGGRSRRWTRSLVRKKMYLQAITAKDLDIFFIQFEARFVHCENPTWRIQGEPGGWYYEKVVPTEEERGDRSSEGEESGTRKRNRDAEEEEVRN